MVSFVHGQEVIQPQTIAGDVARNTRKAETMNTKTTTTDHRFAIASNGIRFELPAFFPTAWQRRAMRQELTTHPTDAMIRLISHMNDVLRNGDAVDGAELAQIWDNAEREYFEATGHEWTFDVAETQHEEKAQNIPAQPARVEIPGIRKDAEEDLLSYIERHPFQMIRKEAYSAAFLGACSSRRAGLNWHIWAKRMTNAGMNPSVVAHIVLKAYRMPSSELVGFRR